MSTIREMRFSCIVLAVIAAIFSGCNKGDLPTAVQQPQELFAPFVKQGPTLDGRGNDEVWQKASAYRVFLDANTGGVNVPSQGLLMEFKAVWWKETKIDTARKDTAEVAFVGFLASWPDADKNIDHQPWTYDPAAAKWSLATEGSDWLLMYWYGLTKDTDIWFWDAALTNPMGYFQDMTLEGFQVGRTFAPYLVRIDGLNFFNDTATNRNTWDANYDDNKTPRQASDDRPRAAWKADPKITPPRLPPVYSDPTENFRFLLDAEAADLSATVFAQPASAVTVPSFVLQEPQGGCADIRAFGRHENGRWTLEFFRKGTGTETSDIPFDPDERFFSQVFSVALGNHTLSPFDQGATEFKINNTVLLTFQFILEE
jgi:hypothetical protein